MEQLNRKDMELLMRMDERQKSMAETIESIYEEVKKTNGRVTRIESERLPSLEHWRSRMKGVWLAVIILATIVGAIIEYVITLLTK